MPALILLEGGLGAGKTTWVRHLLRALGVSGRIKSPSYAVLESYAPPVGAVHHFDFYRFSDPREWEDAGFREILSGEGLKLVEWPEHAQGLLPQADLRLQIQDEAEEGGPAHGERAGPEPPVAAPCCRRWPHEFAATAADPRCLRLGPAPGGPGSTG